MDRSDPTQQLAALADLSDPVRRALYRYVSQQGAAVGRDEAAKAVGIGRPLAAYHLDKLVDSGLLEASFQRRSGRSGPGAGRPAKLYRRAARQIELTLPARDYAVLAELLAQAVEADASGAARTALERAAGELGGQLGAEAASQLPPDATPDDLREVARQALARRGYEPYEDADGVVRLRNCPFDHIAAGHRDLVCGGNLAMIRGLVERLDPAAPFRPELDPWPGQCCVALHTRN
jgi:predicted ArsR family transcriptional regulator